MLGMVFTEFLEMVETRFSPDMADAILEEANPPNGGAYTAVGYYDHAEMVALLLALARQTGQPVPALLQAFGQYLFSRFVTAYPMLFETPRDAFALLASVDNYIHVEVHKLYPSAELPHFNVLERDDSRMVLEYRSPRGLADLAEGLIQGAIAHFGHPLALARHDQPPVDGVHTSLFTLSTT